jgi:hypothetical protein
MDLVVAVVLLGWLMHLSLACPSGELTKLTVTETIPIGYYKGCNKLTTVTIGNGVKEIKARAFQDCTKLKTLIINGESAELTEIGPYAFQNTDLTSVTIPAKVVNVGVAAFKTSSLESVNIYSPNAEFDNSFFDEDGVDAVAPNRVAVTKKATEMYLNFPSSMANFQCEGGSCICKLGYGNTLNPNSTLFSCDTCNLGESSPSDPSGFGACTPCQGGTYGVKTEYGLHSCAMCTSGKYSIQVGQNDSSVCGDCPLGKYVAESGATQCDKCPPGNKCSVRGLKMFTNCEEGTFQSQFEKISCTLCPVGTYQDELSQTACTQCPAGKHNSDEGMASESRCLDCEPGKYSSQSGFAFCTTCETGYFQEESGKSECILCKEFYGDAKLTNNAGNTGCMIDPALDLPSFWQVMFDNGIALPVTVAIAFMFVAMGAFAHYVREQEPERLANFTKFDTFYHSFLAGFGAGAELLMVLGIWSEMPAVAAIMMLSRLLHFFAGTVLSLSLFGPLERVLAVDQYLPFKLSSLRADLDRDFVYSNIYVVECTVLLSFCDVTMLTFLPWNKSEYYTLSEGYPSSKMMKSVLGVKALQSFVSVVCEMIYLATTLAVTSAFTQALFYLNIIFGVATVLMDLVVLLLRGEVLLRKEKEKLRRQRESRQTLAQDMDLSSIYGKDGDEDVEGGDHNGNDGNGGTVQLTDNPLHASIDLARESDRENLTMLQQQLAEKDVELAQTKKDLKRKSKKLKELERASVSEPPGGVGGGNEGELKED